LYVVLQPVMNSDGQQFNQYEQYEQSPLNSDCQQFHQHHQTNKHVCRYKWLIYPNTLQYKTMKKQVVEQELIIIKQY